MMIWRVKRCRWTFTGVAVRPLSSQLWFFSRIFLFVPILVWHVFFPTPGALTSVQNIPVYLSSSGVHLPESNGVWLEGPGTIRLALLRHSRDAKFLFTVHSLVPNTLGILAGGSFFSANLSPEARTSFELAPQNGIGMHGREWIKCRIGIKAGAVPKEIWENSLDPRKLGVFLSIQQTDANLSPSH